MNLTQLKYFHAVCLYETVSEAATYLYISQPSLSTAIKELEKEFGVILFKRQHRGMKLTPEGEILYQTTKNLIAQTEEVENIMKDLGTERRILRLGIPPMIGSLMLPAIYRDFPVKYPSIKLEIAEHGRQELIKKLNDGLLDMVFLPHNKPLEEAFKNEEVAHWEIVCCMAKNNSIAKNKKIKLSELTSTPLVLFENSFFQTEEIKKRFLIKKITPNILLQTNQLSTMLSIISNGVAVGFAFNELLGLHPDIVGIPLEDPMHVNISLVWKKNAYFSNSMTIFQNYMFNDFHLCSHA